MVKAHFNIRVSDSIKKPGKVIEKINKGRKFKAVYLVGFLGESKRLEIYNSFNFLEKWFKDNEFTLCYLGPDEASAIEYVRALSEISVKKYNDFLPLRCIDELKASELIL